ncbi:hypothetical protein HanRHA438_Chr04g0163441 [Helianthus annuus]|nr:hypothetical protein HanIR_Chr04g0165121 [Helianthus annuus]KAJ0925766.1 hypothetical protein HanRHA438_Chr04g0163441 [Helianthus annuus]
MNPRFKIFIPATGAVKVFEAVFKWLVKRNAVGSRDWPEREVGGGRGGGGGGGGGGGCVGGGGGEWWDGVFGGFD